MLVCALAPTWTGAAGAKGYSHVVLVGSDGRSVGVRAGERVIDGLLSGRGAFEPIRGGYVRLFFVGPGGFPTSSARYYGAGECVALDWRRYETRCARIDATLVRLLRPARALARFRVGPTVLVSIDYRGRFAGAITSAAALKDPVELALDRPGRRLPRPSSCYGFSGRWRGPAEGDRPRRFLLCAGGIYADGRLYPLLRGVWGWFRLNVG